MNDNSSTSGLASAPVHRRLAAFFQIDTETQRRIGTLVVMFSMTEQAVEWAILGLKGEPLMNGRAPTTDRMTVSDRFNEIRGCADARIGRSAELLRSISEIGLLLTSVRHTIVHGSPLESATLSRNRSWFGEARKRQHAQVTLSDEMLDSTAAVADLLFKVLVAVSRAADEIDLQSLADEYHDELLRARDKIDRIREGTIGSL